MITVMGATGQVGSQIVRRLLAAGEQVRAVGAQQHLVARRFAPRFGRYPGDR